MGKLADLGRTGAAAAADEPRPGVDPGGRQRRDSSPSPLASGMPGLGHRVVEIVGCAVSSLLRHVGVMTSETLARAGARGVLVVPEVRVASRRGMTGGSVSVVLTSQAHRRYTPRKNRSIPTIPAGNIDAGHVHVSAVDTGPRRSESGVLGGRARRLRHRSSSTVP